MFLRRTYGTSLVAQTVKNLPAMQRPKFDPWVGKIPWRKAWLTYRFEDSCSVEQAFRLL